jgi:ribonuclease HII
LPSRFQRTYDGGIRRIELPAAAGNAMTTALERRAPDWRFEKAFWRAGRERVAGVDEVGRGPLAGPVMAGAVVMRHSRASWVRRLRDSKQLDAATREELAARIQDSCDWGLGLVSQHVIDQIGIVWATRLAMRRAVLALPQPPHALLVDGREVVYCGIEQRAVIDADEKCMSVAAASIIAKVARDELMEELGEAFPGYGLESNKGYASPDHLEALRRLGYSSVHRLSFAPVRAAVRR